LIAEYAYAAIDARIGTTTLGLEALAAPADTPSVGRLVEEEEGFGLIELLFALVILNVGIFALMASFQSGALAVSRSASISNGAVVADKVMEVYRDLKNCAIYLHATGTGTDNVTTTLPDGVPKSTSSWYAAYSGDTTAYANTVNGANQTAYFSYTTPPTSAPQWVTEYTPLTGAVTAYCPTSFPAAAGALSTFNAATGVDPTAAVQKVTGPDGQPYPVFTYIVLLQTGGTGYTGGYVKQVTVVVRNPRLTSQTLARTSSIFDPYVAP
jgi:type II secretory pathway pseudopilin PulG